MTDSPERRFAEDMHQLLAPLSEPLHDAFAFAHHCSEEHVPSFRKAGKMAHLKSGLIRAGVREHLADMDLDGWVLAGNPDLCGQLMLRSRTGRVVMRVLKAAPSPQRIPHAGRNHVRRAYWQNQPALELGQLEHKDVDAHSMLLLWRPSADGMYDLRAIRPLAPGRYRGGVPFDVAIDLAPTRSDFEKLEFRGAPLHDVDLFEEQIAEDDRDAN